MLAGRMCWLLVNNVKISYGGGSGSAKVLPFPLLILQGGRHEISIYEERGLADQHCSGTRLFYVQHFPSAVCIYIRTADKAENQEREENL